MPLQSLLVTLGFCVTFCAIIERQIIWTRTRPLEERVIDICMLLCIIKVELSCYGIDAYLFALWHLPILVCSHPGLELRVGEDFSSD